MTWVEVAFDFVTLGALLSGLYLAAHLFPLVLRLFGAALGYLYTRKKVEAEREDLIGELSQALVQINSLQGLLPICASCKKIRDDKGYWNQLEEYIQEHSEAEFSHGICPDCARKLYPDYYTE